MVFRAILGIIGCVRLIGLAINPFEIDFPSKKELTDADYEEVQKKLRNKSIEALIDTLCPVKWKYSNTDLCNRCSNFLKQTMIDPSKGLYPVVHFSSLETTEDCIVLGCSYDRNYPELLVSAVEALRELGWNKGIYYRIGGFANPTQEEIRYAGVPYAMKMFLLKEAHLLGFKNLLWLDASVWPIQNPEFCFEKIRKEGIFCEMGRPNTLLTIPQTRSILEKYCGEDLSKVDHCAGWILGFDMSRVAVQQLFEDFYEMARLGTPFISITPEEMVLSVLIHKHFGSVPRQQRLMLPDEKERSRFIQARKEGYKFMIRRH